MVPVAQAEQAVRAESAGLAEEAEAVAKAVISPSVIQKTVVPATSVHLRLPERAGKVLPVVGQECEGTADRAAAVASAAVPLDQAVRRLDGTVEMVQRARMVHQGRPAPRVLMGLTEPLTAW